MKSIEINNHKITVYDDIMEMPVVRYNKYQKYMVLASGVGNDIPAIISKVNDMQKMVGDEKKYKKLNAEFLALKNALSFVDGGVDPHSLAFACMIRDFDGEECSVDSEDSIDATAKKLSEMATKRQLMESLFGLKKKSKKLWSRTSQSNTGRKQTSKHSD